MNIIIPMGGKGLRFKSEGISMPKPLIEVDGVPMIKKVIQSIQVPGQLHYIMRLEHKENYHLNDICYDVRDGKIWVLEGDNGGQTATCLLAKEDINNDQPLLIVNCDNYLIWKTHTFEDLYEDETIDGAAFTFTDPQKRSHWCFATVDDDNRITSLAEKNPISDTALAGGFYWRRGSDFVKYAEEQLSFNRNTNGEFYLGGVFEMAIEDGRKIVAHPIDDMKCFGTPEELRDFQQWVKDKKKQKGPIINNRNVQDAIDELRDGKPIVLVDEHDRENEGDIVIAAEKATKENLVFTMNNARGLMCVPCDGEILDRLEIPPMVEDNTDNNETPFTVSVDSVHTSTGMSVDDRLMTIQAMLDPQSLPEELTRPGHLFPLRPREGLLQERRGHTEGSIELMNLAELNPVSIICEIMNDDGTMAKGGQLNRFATKHGLTIVSIEELYEAVYHESL